jgi:hypothetical protein
MTAKQKPAAKLLLVLLERTMTLTFLGCGEGGIRTREGVTLTRVPGERTSPLCDLSLMKL